MHIRDEMLFETTIRVFLGDAASHIAGQLHDENSKKSWYRKVVKKIIKRIQTIETSMQHKRQLEIWSNELSEMLGKRGFDEQLFSLCLLRLNAALLGFMGIRGACLVTPAYFQTSNQYYTQVISSGGDVLQDYYDKKSAISIRAKLISQLRGEGLNDFNIALVLNISEYEVKKLRAEL